ncbi:MAG: hypothetical protein ACI8RD_009411, partial [Bacillariaceae sp.]|jgi:hypothetical protein
VSASTIFLIVVYTTKASPDQMTGAFQPDQVHSAIVDIGRSILVAITPDVTSSPDVISSSVAGRKSIAQPRQCNKHNDKSTTSSSVVAGAENNTIIQKQRDLIATLTEQIAAVAGAAAAVKKKTTKPLTPSCEEVNNWVDILTEKFGDENCNDVTSITLTCGVSVSSSSSTSTDVCTPATTPGSVTRFWRIKLCEIIGCEKHLQKREYCLRHFKDKSAAIRPFDYKKVGPPSQQKNMRVEGRGPTLKRMQ